MRLCSSFLLVMRKSDQWKNEICRLLVPPTTTQNGGEKSIEYCQLKAATLAEEGQEVFVAAIFAFHAGKAVVQVPAIEMPVNDLLQIGPPEAVLPGEMLVIDPDKGLKIVIYAAVIIG